MQKVTSATTFPYIISRLYLQSLHFLQRPNHKSLIQAVTLRFKVYENSSSKSIEFSDFRELSLISTSVAYSYLWLWFNTGAYLKRTIYPITLP